MAWNMMRCLGSFVIVAMIVGAPFFRYRYLYEKAKRLRAIDDGRIYRSGQLTESGFRDAVQRLRIKTVINVQNEVPDPILQPTFKSNRRVTESVLCRQMGVRYVHLAPDLCSERLNPSAQPRAVGQFLALCNDSSNYPILLHCRAGLHRTGVLAAIYRMEFDGWDHDAVVRELKAHGFGDTACTAANDYVTQYILNFRSRGIGIANEIGRQP